MRVYEAFRDQYGTVRSLLQLPDKLQDTCFFRPLRGSDLQQAQRIASDRSAIFIERSK